jgi:hypothetical protein
MEKLKLSQVTLICLTSKDFEGHKKAIDKSCEGIEWGGVKIIWDEKITSIDEWNRKIVFDLWKYVDTDYAMLIHADGYVIRPDLWRDEFLNYDFIGAPWPLPQDDYSYRDMYGDVVRVGNSVSLRSKRLLQAPTFHNFKWKSYYGNTNEDGFLCVHNKPALEALGMKFAPLDVAKHFSKEHIIPENILLDTFAFHSL